MRRVLYGTRRPSPLVPEMILFRTDSFLIKKINAMKTIKKISLSILFILFVFISYAQEPATITLVTSKNVNDAGELFVDLDGKINTDVWTKTHVRIVMEIKADGVTREVAKTLMRKGRFLIEVKSLDEQSVLLSMPNLQNPVYINGYKLTENITFRIFVPENLIVKFKSWEDLKVEYKL